MASQEHTPIVFTIHVSQRNWDEDFGGWLCPALRIPGAEVDGIFTKGRRAGEDDYRVERDNQVVRWLAPEPKPVEATISIKLTKELSSQEQTDKWRRRAAVFASVATILAAVITVSPFYLLRQTPQTSNLNGHGAAEHAVFNLSPVYGDCGLVTVNGSIEMPARSQEKVTRLHWDWGDKSKGDDSFFPATHHYSQNDTYTVKVTAYISNNETDEKDIKVVVNNANQANCPRAGSSPHS
jgi:hypothetical protein